MGWMAKVSNHSTGKDFLSFKSPARLCSSPGLLFSRYWCSVPELKRPERDVVHSPASGDEFKN
jgi:hypothetical protein